jgi:ribonuclease VapC
MSTLYSESGGDLVQALLERAARGEAQVAMTVVNWGEVLYIVQRRSGPAGAIDVILRLDAVPVELVEVDRQLAQRAARFKVAGRIAYADCYAAALAAARGAILVTGDPEFRTVEDQITVEWLPRRGR